MVIPKKIDKFKLILENYKVFFLLYDNIENYKITHQLYNKMLYNRVHSVHIRHGFPTPDISNISDWVKSEIKKLDSDEINDREEFKEPERYFASHFFSIVPEYKKSEALKLWADYESDEFIAGCSDDIDELLGVINRVINKINAFSSQIDITEKDKRILAQSLMRIKLLSSKNEKHDLEIISDNFLSIYDKYKEQYPDIFDSKEENICQGNEICYALGIGSDGLVSLYRAGMFPVKQDATDVKPIDKYGLFSNIDFWTFRKSDVVDALINFGRKDLTYLVYLIPKNCNSIEVKNKVLNKIEVKINGVWEELSRNEIFAIIEEDMVKFIDNNQHKKNYDLDYFKALKLHMNGMSMKDIYIEFIGRETLENKNKARQGRKHVQYGKEIAYYFLQSNK